MTNSISKHLSEYDRKHASECYIVVRKPVLKCILELSINGVNNSNHFKMRIHKTNYHFDGDQM